MAKRKQHTEDPGEGVYSYRPTWDPDSRIPYIERRIWRSKAERGYILWNGQFWKGDGPPNCKTLNEALKLMLRQAESSVMYAEQQFAKAREELTKAKRQLRLREER